jgi:hypothetical protein
MSTRGRREMTHRLVQPSELADALDKVNQFPLDRRFRIWYLRVAYALDEDERGEFEPFRLHRDRCKSLRSIVSAVRARKKRRRGHGPSLRYPCVER